MTECKKCVLKMNFIFILLACLAQWEVNCGIYEIYHSNFFKTMDGSIQQVNYRSVGIFTLILGMIDLLSDLDIIKVLRMVGNSRLQIA